MQPPPVQQRPIEENASQEEKPAIVKIALYPSQTRGFWELLENARDETGISGIFCTVNKCLDLHDGGRLLLELQAARLDRRTTLKIQELLRLSLQKDVEPGN
jgi:hypothetical protein